MKRLLCGAVLAVPLMAGCVQQPARVDSPQTVAADKSYTLDLPLGWVRQFTQNGALLASRDGFLLETILVERSPLKSAFPKTKKAATANTLPSELAELVVAELKATNELLSALTVVETEPALVSGREGFRLRVAYRNERGLEILREVIGVTDKEHYYQLSFIAPKLYYFAKYQPDFARSAESFKLASTN
jgi:hypothetical protein